MKFHTTHKVLDNFTKIAWIWVFGVYKSIERPKVGMQLTTKCSLLLSKKKSRPLFCASYRDVVQEYTLYLSTLEDVSLFHIYRMQKPRTSTNAGIYLLNFLSDYVILFLLQEMKTCKITIWSMCHGYIFKSILWEYNINWKLLHENFIQHKEYPPVRTPTCQTIPGCHYAYCQLFVCLQNLSYENVTCCHSNT